MNKILFTDIDSTLIPYCGTMSKKTHDAILKMLADNNKLVLSSGRSINSMMSVVKRCSLMLDGCYAICYNGAQFIDIKTGNRQFTLAIDKKYTDFIVTESRKHGFTILMYEDNGVVAETTSENIVNRYKNQGVGFRIADLTKDPNVNRLKLVISNEGENAHASLRSFRECMMAEVGDVLDLYFSSDTYLEVVLIGVNKGNALKKVCECFNIHISNSVAAGDEENDLSMIKAAGVGCAVANAAVANAIESVKAVADFVTENDCEHDGIVEIIDKYIMG